ncbi:MAG: hypothetical protein GQ539_08265, partial [Sulfitobacter sp.]|nr:hypothetical protein [Sulfitobacter sp.]
RSSDLDLISYKSTSVEALTLVGANGGTGAINNNVSYIDILVSPATGDAAPDFAGTGDPSKLSLTVGGVAGPAVASLLDMGNGVTRVFLDGVVAVGDAVLTIAKDAFGADGAKNRALALNFHIAGAQATIQNPGPDGTIGIGTLNGRGYVDLSFARPDGGLRIGSIIDLAPEFKFIGSNVTIAFDDTQAPEWLNPDDPSADPDTITEDYRFRYWTTGTYTPGTTIERIASIDGEATVLRNDGTAVDTTGAAGFVATTLDISWIDIRFTPTFGDQIEFGTLGDEITVTGATLSGDVMRIGDGLTVRYFLSGPVAAGTVGVSVNAGTFSSGANAGEGSETSFQVLQLSGALADPVAGGVIGQSDLNNRGYIDVRFVKPSYAFEIDVASVLDLAPEVIFSATGGTIAADLTQAPLYLGMDGDDAVFRIWYIGSFQGSDVADNVTVEFIGGSFNSLDTSGNTIDAVAANNSAELQVQSETTGVYFLLLQLGTSELLDTGSFVNGAFTLTRADGSSLTVTGNTARAPPGQIELTITGGTSANPLVAGEFVTLSYGTDAWTYDSGTAIEAQATQTLSITRDLTNGYIDVTFAMLGDLTTNPLFALNSATLNGDEFTLSGAGSSVSILAIAPDDMGNGTYRYYTTGAFTTGTVLVTFHAGKWADLAGNTGAQSIESFKVIDRVADGAAPADGDTSSRIFYIEIAGGIRYNVPGISDPLLEERGMARLTFGTYADPDRGDVFRFTLKFSGTAKVYKLGNIGSIAGSFTIEDGGDTGRPEFWGVAAVQTNLSALAAFGLHVNGNALLQINLSGQERTETISLEGISGDLLGSKITGANVNALVLNRTASLFAEEAVDASVRQAFSVRNVTLDDNATIALTKRFDGDVYQWRITSGASTYYVDQNGDGTLSLSSEAREFTMPAGSFAFEIQGSIKLTIPGGNPDTDALAELSGGFYISITRDRAEVFALANVVVGPSDAPLIEGRAQGLFIVNYTGTNDGIAGKLSLERTGGSEEDGGSQANNDFAGIDPTQFRLDVTISLQFNTTLALQEFTVPTSFLSLLPPDAEPTVKISAGLPNFSDPDDLSAVPSVYFIASL